MARKKPSKIDLDYNSDDLFSNEDEKIRVQALPEVERETIINERVEKLLEKNDRDRILSGPTKYEKTQMSLIKYKVNLMLNS